MIVTYIGLMTNTSHTSGRPGRPREFDTDAALDKAIARFSEHGYHGTSISDLNASLELTSGSIYKAWGDKRGLFLAALDRYMEVRAEAIRSCLAAESSGRDKISALLAMYAQLSSGAVGRTGCLVVESAVELSMSDPEIAKRIAAQQKKREIQLRQLLEVGQSDGSVRRDLDAAVTARLLLTLQQGMRVLGKTGSTAKDMRGLVSEMLRLLD
jgi:AcrR family transcriptional regulator